MTEKDPNSCFYRLHIDIGSSDNVRFFSTVAEWREACAETHRAHSPWERGRGRRAFLCITCTITSTQRLVNRQFTGLNIHMCLFFLSEAVQCISDFVRHHSSEQRPGQSAPRDFAAWSFADCGGVVSQRDANAHSHTLLEDGETTIYPMSFYRQECVEQLLQNMFSGERTESCIVNGIQVLLTLLEIRRPVWVADLKANFCINNMIRCYFIWITNVIYH